MKSDHRFYRTVCHDTIRTDSGCWFEARIRHSTIHLKDEIQSKGFRTDRGERRRRRGEGISYGPDLDQPDPWINDVGQSGRGHPRRCRAHSSRTGERCAKYAIRGAPTCRSHGSAAKHVRRAARLRIAALVDPSLDVLAKMLMPGHGYVKPDLQLRAACDVLNRNGLKGGDDTVLMQRVARTSFSHLTDEEMETLVRLVRKASILVDTHDG